MSEWQTIDSAPHGEYLLVWRKDCNVFIAGFFEPYPPDKLGGAARGWHIENFGFIDDEDYPAFWMPLPKPPEI